MEGKRAACVAAAGIGGFRPPADIAGREEAPLETTGAAGAGALPEIRGGSVSGDVPEVRACTTGEPDKSAAVWARSGTGGKDLAARPSDGTSPCPPFKKKTAVPPSKTAIERAGKAIPRRANI